MVWISRFVFGDSTRFLKLTIWQFLSLRLNAYKNVNNEIFADKFHWFSNFGLVGSQNIKGLNATCAAIKDFHYCYFFDKMT